MNVKSFIIKNQHNIMALAAIVVIGIFIGVRYDYYYELNDDVMMKDLLSGVYTGMPESRNIQMLYPLSLLLSLFYRIFPSLPVYGFFLIACQLGCFYLLIGRCIKYRSNLLSRVFITFFSVLLIVCLFLEHLAIVQYTVTSALLAGTAVFLFLTAEEKKGSEQSALSNLFQNAGSIALIVLAYTLRSEMLLLLMPMVCVAGVWKWLRESKIFCKKNVMKYLTVFGGLLCGLLLVFLVNGVAYGSGEWMKFMDFFNKRTELYDYQVPPKYEGNEAFYEGLGLEEAEYLMLLEEYNFGMDEAVDADMLLRVALKSERDYRQEHSPWEIMKECIKKYVYRMTHGDMSSLGIEDYPWNLLVILAYLSVLIGGIWHGIIHGEHPLGSVLRVGWKLLLLVVVRTGLWLFILFRARDPVRITHSLYLMELFALLAALLVISTGIDAKLYGRIKATLIFPLMLSLVLLFYLPAAILKTDTKYSYREQINETDIMLREYCRQRPEDFFWIDVYTSVHYSQKMLKDTDNRVANYDIMGGWACKSPLYYKKLELFGLTDMRDDFLTQDKVYLAAEVTKGTDWMIQYYEQQGLNIRMELIDTINHKIGIYKLSVAK